MACFRCGCWIITATLFLVFLTTYANSADPNVVQVPSVNGVKLMCPSTVPNDTAVIWKGPDGAQLNFDNRTFPDARMSFVDDRDLQIADAVPNDNGVYTCVNGNQEANVTLAVYVTGGANLKMSFLDAYWDTSIGQNQLRTPNNVTLTVTCMIQGAFPMPVVSFEIIDHNGTQFSSIPANSVNIQSVQESDKTYSVNATTDIVIDSILFNNRRINCIPKFTVDGADITALESAYFYLNPLPPTLFVYQGLRTLDASDNILEFVCHGERGRPAIEAVNFYIEGQPVAAPYNFTQSPLKCGRFKDRDQYYYDMYACNSTLTLSVTKMDNGKSVTCDFMYQNETIGRFKTTDTQMIDFRFPPTMINLTGNVPVEASGSSTHYLTLTCSTDSSSGGAPQLSWYNGSVPINNTQAKTTTPGMYAGEELSQQYMFAVDRYMDGNVIKCEARQFYLSGSLTASVTLNVSYSPEIIQPMSTLYRVYSEEKIAIPCSVLAKPTADTKWMRVYSDTNKTEVTSSVTMSNGNTVLLIEYVTMMHAGKYECQSSNGIQPSDSKAIELIVLDKNSIQPYQITKLTPATNSIVLEFNKPSDREIQYMFLQYTKLNNLGEPASVYETEIAIPSSDSTISVTLGDLTPGSTYSLSLREVGAKYGLVATSFLRTVTTAEPEVDNEYSRRDLNIAIVISVLVTAAVVAIICVIIFVAVKKGGCCNTSNSKYDMQMNPRA